MEVKYRAFYLLINVIKFMDSLIFKQSIKIISDQLIRSITSIGANIAEGFGRFHFADKIKFYYQARGSLNEVQNFLLLGKDLNLLKNEILEEIWIKTKNCEKLLNGLIRSANNNK